LIEVKTKMADKPNKPVYKAASHGVTVSVWEQTSKDKGKFYTAQIQRSYQDNEKEWKNTDTLRMSDLPVLRQLLDKVYDKYAIKEL